MRTKVLVGMLLASVSLTSCFSLPELSEDQKNLADGFGEVVCVGAAMKKEGISEENMQKYVQKYGENIAEGFQKSPVFQLIQDQDKVNSITADFENDPLLAATFANAVVTSIQSKCDLKDAQSLAGDMGQLLQGMEVAQ